MAAPRAGAAPEAAAPEIENQAGPVAAEAETTARIIAEDGDTALAANRAGDAASPAPLWSRNDDPALAQLALTMTQVMTDLTADATVLTRENRIVAFSGEMPLEQFRRLRREIADDWTAAESQSRIRFVKLPDSGLDYMLYSRASVAEHSLTLVFAGGRHLRDIRRQGDRMLGALDMAPAADAPRSGNDESAPASEADERQPFAFVWLLDDRSRRLQKPVAEQLVFWLEVQLNSMNWRIRRLDVHHDFIHLCADVPGRASPDALVRAVMDRARQIACAEDGTPARRALGGCLPRAAAGARHERARAAALPAIRPRLRQGQGQLRLSESRGVGYTRAHNSSCNSPSLDDGNAPGTLSDRWPRARLSQLFRPAAWRLHHLKRRERQRGLWLQPHPAGRHRALSAEIPRRRL